MRAARSLSGAAFLTAVLALGAGCNALTGVGDLQIEDGETGGEPSAPSGAGGAPSAGPTPTSTTGGGAAPSSGSVAASSSSSSGQSSTASSSSSSSSSSTSGASSSSSSSSSSSGNPLDAAAGDCVDTINLYRATLGLAPYARWTQEETCAGQQGQKDSQTMTAHSAFQMCGEWAQNECPGWPGPPGSMIEGCLAQMWAEGPGDFSSGHGHYDNMSSTQYTKVACGFYTLADGSVWAAQDFQ